MKILVTFSLQNMIQVDKVAPATAMKEMEKLCNNMTCVKTY